MTKFSLVTQLIGVVNVESNYTFIMPDKLKCDKSVVGPFSLFTRSIAFMDLFCVCFMHSFNKAIDDAIISCSFEINLSGND